MGPARFQARFQAGGMSPRPGPGLAPGTRVTAVVDGRVCAGVVAYYEPDLHLTHRTFPVRFTETGRWRLLSARDVTVVQTHDKCPAVRMRLGGAGRAALERIVTAWRAQRRRAGS